jgi:hypothetical protein
MPGGRGQERAALRGRQTLSADERRLVKECRREGA